MNYTVNHQPELTRNTRREMGRSYLLRCYREAGAEAGGKPAWHFTLIQITGGREKKGFACLGDLAAYLGEALEG